MKNRIAQLVDDALARLPDGAATPELTSIRTTVERTRDSRNGDFATNIAMRLAKAAGKNPRELAALIVDALPQASLLEKVEIAGPGFINFFVGEAAFHAEIAAIIDKGDRYGRQSPRAEPKILLEFVSANPTGPLHVGHGRHAAFGATLGNLLEAAGYSVDREYYVNDAGRQMDILAVSVLIRALEAAGADVRVPSGAYEGDYIHDIAASAPTPRVDAVGLFSDLPDEEDKDKYIDALIKNAKRLTGDDAFARLREHSH